jgi:hypothetical protein
MERLPDILDDFEHFKVRAIGLIPLERVPGLTALDIEKLKKEEMTSTEHLVGLYWCCNRNKKDFMYSMQQYNIPHKSSSEVWRAMNAKFGCV